MLESWDWPPEWRIFTFGNTAKESYERMIKYVTIAEKFINKHKRKNIRHRKFNFSYDSNDISLKIRKSVYDLSERKWILNFCNLKKITEFTVLLTKSGSATSPV